MVRWVMVRISRPVRPACCAEASRSTPTSRPGLGRSLNLRPEMVTLPAVGLVRPTMTRMVVDLPAPFGPRNPVTRPGRAVKVTSSTARVFPYLLVIRASLNIDSPASLVCAAACCSGDVRRSDADRDLPACVTGLQVTHGGRRLVQGVGPLYARGDAAALDEVGEPVEVARPLL